MSTQTCHVEGTIENILATRLGIPTEKISRDARLTDDLHLDSLDLVELLIHTEEQLKVSIPEAVFKEAKTVKDLLAIVEKQVASKEG